MSDETTALGEMPRTIGVRHVALSDLKANPHNPRMLFDREDLTTLEKSIEKVGILVPLTVYRASGSKQYTILDGQRRWMCAQRLGLSKIPVNEVAEPTIAQNIVVMFQIHKLRKDWELMPTALKLAVLMKEINDKRDRTLAVLTGLDMAVVTRCKKLLWYPKRYQDMMLFVDPQQRIKADFFIELYPIVNDRSVRAASWYNRDRFIDQMLDKYENRKSGIKSITDFRAIKQHLTNAAKVRQSAKVLTRLKEFMTNDDLTIEHLEIGTATIHKIATRLVRGVDKLMVDLNKVDPNDFYGEEELWSKLETMLTLLQRKLRQADRRPN